MAIALPPSEVAAVGTSDGEDELLSTESFGIGSGNLSGVKSLNLVGRKSEELN